MREKSVTSFVDINNVGGMGDDMNERTKILLDENDISKTSYTSGPVLPPRTRAPRVRISLFLLKADG